MVKTKVLFLVLFIFVVFGCSALQPKEDIPLVKVFCQKSSISSIYFFIPKTLTLHFEEKNSYIQANGIKMDFFPDNFTEVIKRPRNGELAFDNKARQVFYIPLKNNNTSDKFVLKNGDNVLIVKVSIKNKKKKITTKEISFQQAKNLSSGAI